MIAAASPCRAPGDARRPSLSSLWLDSIRRRFIAYDYTRNGYAPGALESIRFDTDGDVVGQFDNGRSRTLYRLAIADFTNPDGLGGLAGNVYAQSQTSGAAAWARREGRARHYIAADTREKSNVDLGDEFGRMILTQNAYNSSATAFRTLDEDTSRPAT